MRGAGRQERPLQLPPRCAPRRLQPQCPARACLIGGHTLRGRGAESLNSSPPTGHPLPSSPPPPTPSGAALREGGGEGDCCRRPLRVLGSPWAHRLREPARQDRRLRSRVPQTSSPERGLEPGWGPEPRRGWGGGTEIPQRGPG